MSSPGENNCLCAQLEYPHPEAPSQLLSLESCLRLISSWSSPSSSSPSSPTSPIAPRTSLATLAVSPRSPISPISPTSSTTTIETSSTTSGSGGGGGYLHPSAVLAERAFHQLVATLGEIGFDQTNPSGEPVRDFPFAASVVQNLWSAMSQYRTLVANLPVAPLMAASRLADLRIGEAEAEGGEGEDDNETENAKMVVRAVRVLGTAADIVVRCLRDEFGDRRREAVMACRWARCSVAEDEDDVAAWVGESRPHWA